MGQRGHCNVNCAPLKHHLPSGKVVKKKKAKPKIKQTTLPPQIFHVPPIPKQKRLNNKEQNAIEFNGSQIQAGGPQDVSSPTFHQKQGQLWGQNE